MMLAIGRTQLGGSLYALYNIRYITLANAFWVGLLMLGAKSLQYVLKSRYGTYALAFSCLLVGGYAALLLQTNFDIVIRNIRMSITEETRACVLNYLSAIKENPECLRASAPDPWHFYPRMVELAKRRLTVYGDWYTDFQPALQPALAHTQPILGGDYIPFWIGNSPDAAILFQHPPSTAEQYLQLPNAPKVFFEAEIYVDLRNIREHPDVPQTGADFRLSIREGRHIQTLYEGSFDVNVEREPIPFRVDLSQWRGKAVVLVYETLIRQDNASYAWAMWRNPRLVTE